MTQTAHVLELNGVRYDATTGRPLTTSQKSMDGVLLSAPAMPISDVRPNATPHTSDLRHQTDTHRASVHHTAHHPVQHSKTLMRSSVHHPGDALKRHLKSVQHTSTLVKAGNFDIVPKYSADIVDPARLQRAHEIARSHDIRRFSAGASIQGVGSLSRGTATYQPRSTQAAPAAHLEHLGQPIAKHQPSDDIFERALAAANSHKQPYVAAKKTHKKLHRLRQVTSIAASSLTILLIVGFVAYQNTVAIQLRLASSQAGINATLPAWQPSGFRLGALSSSPGKVSVSYVDRVSSEKFTITQSATTWDSNTLLNEFVYPNNETYNTISSNGSTIYTYGDNNASWVNGGIWYKLTSNGTLSNSQIVNIATSMQS